VDAAATASYCQLLSDRPWYGACRCICQSLPQPAPNLMQFKLQSPKCGVGRPCAVLLRDRMDYFIGEIPETSDWEICGRSGTRETPETPVQPQCRAFTAHSLVPMHLKPWRRKETCFRSYREQDSLSTHSIFFMVLLRLFNNAGARVRPTGGKASALGKLPGGELI